MLCIPGYHVKEGGGEEEGVREEGDHDDQKHEEGTLPDPTG